jgi:hypothetical protein
MKKTRAGENPARGKINRPRLWIGLRGISFFGGPGGLRNTSSPPFQSKFYLIPADFSPDYLVSDSY